MTPETIAIGIIASIALVLGMIGMTCIIRSAFLKEQVVAAAPEDLKKSVRKFNRNTFILLGISLLLFPTVLINIWFGLAYIVTYALISSPLAIKWYLNLQTEVSAWTNKPKTLRCKMCGLVKKMFEVPYKCPHCSEENAFQPYDPLAPNQ